MQRKTLLITGILAFLFSSCVRKTENKASFIKLIERLSPEVVLATPLKEADSPNQIDGSLYPQDSRPLEIRSGNHDPLLLAREMRFGGTVMNILYAPASSEYAFPLEGNGQSVFEFGLGLSTGGDSGGSESKPRLGVHFQVKLEAAGNSRSLFEKYLELEENPDFPGFILSRHSVELPDTKPGGRLILKTRGTSPAQSFWINPVIWRQEEDPVRVILISLDTLRADHLGCYGYARDTSPNMDSLSHDAAMFLNTFSSAPWTLPSHVAMLTSLHGIHHQVYQDDEKMSDDLVTLAQMLSEFNFPAAAFTGGGFVSAVYGFSRGFDLYDEGSGGVHHQDSAERTWRAAESWIDRNWRKSFFLFLHTYQTHSPYACPPPYKVMFLNDDSLFGHVDLLGHLGGKEGIFQPLPEEERKNIIDLYDGEIRYTDEELIAPLIGKLKQLGIYDQSMIVLTSDHGEEFFDHGGWGHGHSLYNESLKVPLIIKFPHSRFRGEVRENFVSLVDIMPTILDVLDIPMDQRSIDGRSLVPILENKEDGDRTFIADLGDNVLNSHIPQKIAVNEGSEKLILSSRISPDDLSFFTYAPPGIGPVEYYNLLDDPLESTNISDRFPRRVSQLIAWINDLYEHAVKRLTGKAEMNEKLMEQLKGLGYLR